jgi:hypothetical protein
MVLKVIYLKATALAVWLATVLLISCDLVNASLLSPLQSPGRSLAQGNSLSMTRSTDFFHAEAPVTCIHVQHPAMIQSLDHDKIMR